MASRVSGAASGSGPDDAPRLVQDHHAVPGHHHLERGRDALFDPAGPEPADPLDPLRRHPDFFRAAAPQHPVQRTTLLEPHPAEPPAFPVRPTQPLAMAATSALSRNPCRSSSSSTVAASSRTISDAARRSACASSSLAERRQRRRPRRQQPPDHRAIRHRLGQGQRGFGRRQRLLGPSGEQQHPRPQLGDQRAVADGGPLPLGMLRPASSRRSKRRLELALGQQDLGRRDRRRDRREVASPADPRPPAPSRRRACPAAPAPGPARRRRRPPSRSGSGASPPRRHLSASSRRARRRQAPRSRRPRQARGTPARTGAPRPRPPAGATSRPRRTARASRGRRP